MGVLMGLWNRIMLWKLKWITCNHLRHIMIPQDKYGHFCPWCDPPEHHITYTHDILVDIKEEMNVHQDY